MLIWMLYVICVSVLLAGAALAAEHAARLRRSATRGWWISSIVASLVLPAAITSVSIQLPRIPTLVSPSAAQEIVTLREHTAPSLSPAVWLGPDVRDAVGRPRIDALLRRAWTLASCALLMLLVAAGAHLHWRQRRWPLTTVAGSTVYLTEGTGPAVVGLLRPRIAVPRWLIDSTPSTQRVVIAHERAHLEGHDVQLFTVGLLLAVLMPWNVPLWWQLRRLRRAIEVDCDARVLRQGSDATTYGTVLLDVGQRRCGHLAIVAGMSESRSFLEERLRLMLRDPTPGRRALAVALGSVCLALIATAAQVEPPNTGGAHQEITLDAAVLERYTGFYQLADGVFFHITRDGRQLSAQLTGQPGAPVYPESTTRFFYKAVDAQLEFTADASGKITGLILHQHGDHPAPRVDAAVAQASAGALAARVQSQKASPGTEKAAHQLLDWIGSGNPDYQAMTPQLGDAMREQLPRLHASMAALGPVVSIKFVGVGAQGWDLYKITHEHGASQMRVIVDSQGLIAGALLSAGP